MATWPKGAHYYDGPEREKNSDNPKVTDMVRSVTYQSVAFGLAAMQGVDLQGDDGQRADCCVPRRARCLFRRVRRTPRGGGGNVRDEARIVASMLPKKMKKKCDTKRPSVSKSGGPLCCGWTPCVVPAVSSVSSTVTVFQCLREGES